MPLSSRIDVRQQFAQEECVSQRQFAHLSRSHLFVLNVSVVNRMLEGGLTANESSSRLVGGLTDLALDSVRSMGFIYSMRVRP